MTTDCQNRIRNLLLGDPVAHASHLSMMEAHGVSMRYFLVENEGRWGLLMLLPVDVSSFDRSKYPGAGFVAYLAGCDDSLLEPLIGDLPPGTDYVFKLQKPGYRALVERRFQGEWKRAFLFYSSLGGTFERDPEVRMGNAFDEGLMALWAQNGYCEAEVRDHFSRGACSYALYRGPVPVSTCLVFPNCGRIWEIGAVHTIQTERNKGLARRVVCTALSDITGQGLIPRYNVEDSNAASIALARSMGLTLLSRLDHCYAKEWSPSATPSGGGPAGF